MNAAPPPRRVRAPLELSWIGVGALAIAWALYALWRWRATVSENETRAPGTKQTHGRRWSSQYLADHSQASSVENRHAEVLTPETRRAILALYQDARLPGRDRIRRLYAITGDDGFPYLMPLILDPAIPDDQSRSMLADLLCADESGGMKAYWEDVSDGTYNPKGGRPHDPRLSAPLKAIAVDSRYGKWIRDMALVGLGRLLLDEAGRAIVLNTIDTREDAMLQGTALVLTHQFVRDLTPAQRDELIARSLAIARSSHPGSAKDKAVEVLAELSVDPNTFDFLDGYGSEKDVNVRREMARGFARSGAQNLDAFDRLLGAYAVETDERIREEILLAATGLPGSSTDIRTLQWVGRELGPPTSVDNALILLNVIAQAGAARPDLRPAISEILKSVAEGTQYSPETRQEARHRLAEFDPGR